MTIDSTGPPRTGAVALELDHVGVAYRRRRGLLRSPQPAFWAIENLSLRLYVGETLGVIGRNGAGKSTLLRLLAGIIRPNRGRYVDFGYQATLLSLQVGFVPYLSGRENVILSALLLGLKRSEVEERMPEIVAFAELEEFIDEPIQTYSSGMRARLGFSTAFHVSPDILLIDETLGVGDAAFVEKSKAVMRDRIRSETTVVLVSHSTTEIHSLCDRVIWIERGRQMMEGRTEEVLDAYTRWVRQPGKPPHPVSEAGTGAGSSRV
jgi:lipopolysaccharide transport system ATP-binding protein